MVKIFLNYKSKLILKKKFSHKDLKNWINQVSKSNFVFNNFDDKSVVFEIKDNTIGKKYDDVV